MFSRSQRRIAACSLAVLISILVPLGSSVSRGAPPTILVFISPPPGLGLPVGQHVEVRYRFAGRTPAMLDLATDSVALATDWVEPGQEVAHAWTPDSLGLHQLCVRALGPDESILGNACLAVNGLSAGSPVRVPAVK